MLLYFNTLSLHIRQDTTIHNFLTLFNSENIAIDDSYYKNMIALPTSSCFLWMNPNLALISIHSYIGRDNLHTQLKARSSQP